MYYGVKAVKLGIIIKRRQRQKDTSSSLTWCCGLQLKTDIFGSIPEQDRRWEEKKKIRFPFLHMSLPIFINMLCYRSEGEKMLLALDKSDSALTQDLFFCGCVHVCVNENLFCYLSSLSLLVIRKEKVTLWLFGLLEKAVFLCFKQW